MAALSRGVAFSKKGVSLLQVCGLGPKACYGTDITRHKYLHESSIPTMHFQDSLPHLKVPKLDDTVERYLRAQKVILTDEEYKKTETLAKEFQTGSQGQELQRRLVEGDKMNKHTSYVTEPWFDMYLESRLPLPLNYNPFLAFKPDPKLKNAIDRGTNMIISAVRFRSTLRDGLLKPEIFHLNPARSQTPLYEFLTRMTPRSFSWYTSLIFKAFPLDMSQYNRLLNSTRVPRFSKDELVTYDCGGDHVVVMRKGHIYKFKVVGDNGLPVPPEQIRMNLQYILDDNRPQNHESVGYLTTLERNKWASLREELLKESANKVSLEDIDSSLFVICLETEDPTSNATSLDDIDPVVAQQFTKLMLHGDGANRWFDKSFSLILTPSGQAAINFEHSWGDGVAILRFFNEVYDATLKAPYIPDGLKPSGMVSQVEKLEFQLSETLKKEISVAKGLFDKQVNDLKVDTLKDDRFGKQMMKQYKLSPDAIMQLSFQIAFHRAYKYFPATYESCSTAAFKHGRTETLRPGTLETKACALAFDPNSGVDASTKLKLIREASEVHQKLKEKAVMGQGFDRHLFVLKTIATKNNLEIPFFTDPAYAKLNHIILSTSTLSDDRVLLGGFAPVTSDGLGVGYRVDDDAFGVNVTSYPARDGAPFLECLKKTFEDVLEIITRN